MAGQSSPETCKFRYAGLRILNVSTYLVVAEIIPADVPGGSGRAAWETARSLAARGHRIVVVTRNLADAAEREAVDGIPVLRFSRYLDLHRAAGRIIEEFKPDRLHLHSPFPSFAFRKFARRIPSIYFFHSPWHEEYMIRGADLGRGPMRSAIGAWLRKIVERAVLTSARRIIADSAFMATRLRQHHGLDALVIPLGVDIARFAPGDISAARRKTGLPGDRPVFLTVRNLVSRMGLDNLIGAMPRIVAAFPDALLVIGGQGYLRDALQTRIDQLGLAGHARLIGYIPDELLTDHYRAADIFILPTRTLEGFGLVTLESLACGTPVLATPVGANREVLEGLDARMVMPGNEAADIAAGVIAYLPEYQKRKADVRAACRNYAIGFSWEKYTDRISRVFAPA